MDIHMQHWNFNNLHFVPKIHKSGGLSSNNLTFPEREGNPKGRLKRLSKGHSVYSLCIKAVLMFSPLT